MFDMSQGKCVDYENPDIFFSDEDGIYPRKNRLAAVELCNLCPIRGACLEEAIKKNREGIWGGMTEAERARFVKTGSSKLTYEGRQLAEVMKAENKKRSLLAADSGIPMYKKALEEQGKGMPKDLVKILEARIGNPHMSLTELGEMLGTSKDHIAGKLRRVKASIEKGKPLVWDKKGIKYGPRNKSVLD